MGVDAAFFTVLWGGLLGLGLSVGIELCLLPRPSMLRPAEAWAQHVGLWCATFGMLVLLIGRPLCALATVLALFITLVLVNNAKRRTLREPFVFQDYEYFLDALRHPRLFLPFLGLRSFLLAAAFFALALIGFIQEAPPLARFALHGQLGGALAVLIIAVLLLWSAARRPLSPRFDPEEDLRNLGLLSSLWAYAVAERTPPAATSPFGRMRGVASPILPHLVAVQSESFFDARSLFPGICPDILRAFDVVRAEACMHGSLCVPAWGANTVRTEFAFLTGIAAEQMGVHRFNPYRAITQAAQHAKTAQHTKTTPSFALASLPFFLKSLGYCTLCVHPYGARFYARDRVMPQMGFDEFWDIGAFAGARREGTYVADEEVGVRIIEALRQASSPLFVFAITMENHGPLHQTAGTLPNAAGLYTLPLPAGCEELTLYLQHLRNADAMLGGLRTALHDVKHPAALCWYGDHVPIMPFAYDTLGTPSHVPYVCWSNEHARREVGDTFQRFVNMSAAKGQVSRPLAACALASAWLKSLGMVQ